MDYITLNQSNVPMLDPNVSHKLAEFKRGIKQMKEAEKTISEFLKDEMELKCIKSIKTDEITVTYVAETYSEGFDLERFRLDHPDMYDEYIKIKPKAASVRITVKDKKDED